MKECRSCKKEIDDKAKKCPYCQDKQGNWAKRHPIWTGILGIFLLFFVISLASGEDSDQADTSTPTVETVEAETQVSASETTESDNKTAPVETSSETVSQKNAIRKAKSYLNYTGFSRSGLITQLEFEQFSTEDATYAVDNIVVDWNEQAAKKAASYQNYSGFSRGSMITQLEFEGFTTEQANFGADSVGL